MKIQSVAYLLLLALCACNHVDKNTRTPETIALYNNMKKLSTEGCMLGHQDDLVYVVYWDELPDSSDFYNTCGEYPAIYGWEIAKLEHDSLYNIDGVSFEKMKQHIIDVYDKGGVNTISWHMDNLLTKDNAWDVSSKEVVKSILPGGQKHKEFKNMLDKFVNFNKQLVGADGKQIPIIFRPYHELTGSWFWWGKDLCSPEEYIKLWIFTHNYLVKEKGIKNLLFSYSTAADLKTKADFMERYPGDEYVDFVGFDNYQGANEGGGVIFKETTVNCINIISEIAAKRNKIFAFTEVGFGAIPDSVWFTQTLQPILMNCHCSYALFWRNANINKEKDHFFVPYPNHPSAVDFRKMVADEKIYTLKDIENRSIYAN